VKLINEKRWDRTSVRLLLAGAEFETAVFAGVLSHTLHELYVVLPRLFVVENAQRLRAVVGWLDPHRVRLCCLRLSEQCLSRVHISLHVLVKVLHDILRVGAALGGSTTFRGSLQWQLRLDDLLSLA